MGLHWRKLLVLYSVMNAVFTFNLWLSRQCCTRWNTWWNLLISFNIHTLYYDSRCFNKILCCANSITFVHGLYYTNPYFCVQGLPISIQCDRGRNFVSDLLKQHCQLLGINLTFSSAYHHSGNPAERAIRTVKGLMKHCTMAKQSWRLAFLEYLAISLDINTVSPSELDGCKFN